ncbi:MAG: hypothetical protein ACFBSE_15650 [Prochloraceae cyanobacterium]
MLRSQFNNLFEKAFLWLKNWFNNWVKTNSERTIIEIGQEGTQFLRNIAIGTYLLIIFLGIIGFNIYSLPLPIIRLILAIPVIWVIKEIQFNFIKAFKKFLLFLIWVIGVYSGFGLLVAFSPDLRDLEIIDSLGVFSDLIRETFIEKIDFLNFLDLSEPTILNYCLVQSIFLCFGITTIYLLLCGLAIIRSFISLLEAAIIKMIAMLFAGKKDIPQGIMLVIICILNILIGRYLLNKIGLV